MGHLRSALGPVSSESDHPSKRNSWLAISLIAAALGVGMAERGEAQQSALPSAGCTAAIGGAFNQSLTSFAQTPYSFSGSFTEGEILSFTVATNSDDGMDQATVNHAQTGTAILNVTGPASATFTIPADGTNTFNGILRSGGLASEEAATITLTVTCMPAPAMESMIEQFTQVRIDRLLVDNPHRASLLGRDPAGPAAPGVFNLTGTQRDARFSTSLRQWMARAAEAEQQKAVRAAVAPGGAVLAASPTAAAAPAAVYDGGLDVWAEAHYTHFEDDSGNVDRNGRYLVAYLGADYLVRPDLLVGALIQYDAIDEDADALQGQADGEGYMAGPYISWRVLPRLVFDARAAWGRSDNDQIVMDVKGSYDTERYMVRGALTGDWLWREVRVRPGVSVAYFNEDRDSFRDKSGHFVTGRTVDIGRVIFGPEFSRLFVTERGLAIEPFLNLRGIWDFDRAGSLLVGTQSFLQDEFRARIGGGVTVLSPQRYNIRATGHYEGLFSRDFKALSGQVWVNIPLN